MWFSRTNNGFRGWFASVDLNGALRTGLTSSDITITVRNPADTTSNSPVVAESGKLGLYRFDISSSFFLLNGVGSYGVVIEITSTPKDAMSNVLTVSQNDFDSLFSSSVTISQNSINSIVSGTWNANMSSFTISGSAGDLLASASRGGQSINYAAVADAVWDEVMSGHQISGSAGTLLYSSSLYQPISYPTVADVVWDEIMSGHQISGSAGILLYSASLPFNGTISGSFSVDYAAVADAVWDEPLVGHQVSGSSGFVLSQLSSSIGTISGDLSFIKQINGGRWLIDENTKEMIYYKDDNVTEIARFKLYDKNGVLSDVAPYERVRQ